MKSLMLLLLSLYLGSCSTDKEKTLAESRFDGDAQGAARVVAVEIDGSANGYTFDVTIESPDTGCDQFADWWEVIDLEGNLIYRRILDHSHVTEQPFTRSGGDIDITSDTEVYIRAHMNNSGYIAKALKGSVAGGFVAAELDGDFAQNLAEMAPLPDGCAF